MFHFTNVERLLCCSSGRLLTTVPVPGLLSFAGTVEIYKYRCLLGNVSEFWAGRNRLSGTWGGEEKKKKKRERENSFIILCPNKSCFVTILEIMLPLFAKRLQTVCKSEL